MAFVLDRDFSRGFLPALHYSLPAFTIFPSAFGKTSPRTCDLCLEVRFHPIIKTYEFPSNFELYMQASYHWLVEARRKLLGLEELTIYKTIDTTFCVLVAGRGKTHEATGAQTC